MWHIDAQPGRLAAKEAVYTLRPAGVNGAVRRLVCKSARPSRGRASREGLFPATSACLVPAERVKGPRSGSEAQARIRSAERPRHARRIW